MNSISWTRRIAPWSWLILVALGACTEVDREAEPSDEGAASVQIALREAPEDAGCAHIHVVGPRGQATTREEDLSPGQTTVFLLQGLQAGPSVFSAEAFDAACADVDPDRPSYTSRQVHRRLRVGMNDEVVLVMRPVGTADVDVVLDFPGDERGRWVSLTGSPVGTPARAVFDASESSPSQSFFDVFVEGYFVRERVGEDGRAYSELEFPGMQLIAQVGAPALPAVQLDLAIMTSAGGARLESMEVISEEREQLVPWPTPEAARDHPEGDPEKFARDDRYYDGQVRFPESDGEAKGEAEPMLGSIDGVSVQLYPVHWDPASETLSVASHARFAVDHSGEQDDRQEITKDRALAAEARFANWAAVSELAITNFVLYTADFLFIYPPGYDDELDPLITQKKARGFAVTEMTTTQAGASCAAIRASIAGWYNGTPAWRDKYAILVGDTDVIPQCTAPTGDPTDDLYASVGGDDLNEEIYLGRLSVDSQSDAATQVAKILSYSDSPSVFFDYGNALLVAHMEQAPNKYVGAHESVRTASYAVDPIFTTLYGHVPGTNDSDVNAEINAGMGIVAYRGHGSEQEWTGWNLASEYYDNADLLGLTNSSNVAPVVWSIACLNNYIQDPDAIGERWMETSNRAVAHYGATVPSYTTPNHELDRGLFKAVFDTGLIVHAQALEAAENQMVAYDGTFGTANAWMYLLLGDPEMRIRRDGPRIIAPVFVEEIEICIPGSPCDPLRIVVRDDLGRPLPDVLVSVYKQGPDGQDEVLDNRYADGEGVVDLQIAPTSPGELHLAVRDMEGNSSMDVIRVR